MGDPNLWAKGGQDTKAINDALSSIASSAYDAALAAGAASTREPARIPGVGPNDSPGGEPETPSEPTEPQDYTVPAPQAQLPNMGLNVKLPEIKYDVPQIRDLASVMQQSPIPGVGGLGKALEQAASDTTTQNFGFMRDVPIISALPRGLELLANVQQAYNKELEPVRGYLEPIASVPSDIVKNAFAQAGEVAVTGANVIGDVRRGQLDKIPTHLQEGAQAWALEYASGLAFFNPLAALQKESEFGQRIRPELERIGAEMAEGRRAGQPESDVLGRALGQLRDIGQRQYDQADALTKLVLDTVVDPLTWIPGAGVGEAQKAKAVEEATVGLKEAPKTVGEIVHESGGLAKWFGLGWDKQSRAIETVKTGMQAAMDSTLHAPDFATAFKNIMTWASAGTEGGVAALKAFLNKPNLTLYEWRGAKLLEGYGERAKTIERVANDLGKVTDLRAVDLTKVPEGPLRLTVEKIVKEGISDPAEIGRLLDQGAREHLVSDAMDYMANVVAKELKIPPPNVGERFLNNVVKPIEAIAYKGTAPAKLLTTWANNKASMALEGISPFLSVPARIKRLEKMGMPGAARELEKAEKTYQALAQAQLSVAQATGRMGGAIKQFGDKYSLVRFFTQIEEADRKIARLHGMELGLRNWRRAFRGKGYIPELPAGLAAHLTPEQATHFYNLVRQAGLDPKALRAAGMAFLDGGAIAIDHAALTKELDAMVPELARVQGVSEDAIAEILHSGGHQQALEEAARNITKRVKAGEEFDAVRDDELGKLATAALERFRRPTAADEAFAKRLARTSVGKNTLDESIRQLKAIMPNQASARALGVDAQQQSEAQLFGHVLDAVRRTWSNTAPAIENGETRRQLLRFLEDQVIPAANDARVASLRLGDWYEAATVMNRNGRNFIDNASSLYMPDAFFRLHYGMETLRRVVDRPALLSFYLHLRQSLDSLQNDPSYPARLRGLTRIPLPFLPEYMGGEIFFDPLEKLVRVKEVFGLNQSPQTLDDGDIAQNVRALAVRGVVSQSDAANAIAKKDQSELWRQVKAQLEQNMQATKGANAFMDLFQPHAPVDIAWKVLTGRPQDIGVLFPITRFVKGATATFVPGGINIEQPIKAGLRQLTGNANIPDYDAYEQYRINSELANMVAEGKIDARAAVYAILEQKGPAYTQAQRRVGETAGVSELSFVGAQIFPEGERRYYKAKLARDQLLNSEIQKSGGNPENMTTDQKWDFAAAHGLTKAGTPLAQFAKQHPELEVMDAAHDEPERILKDLLISDLQDKWDTLDKLSQRMVAKQLGNEFKIKFLSKQARGAEYPNVSLEDLVTWAKAFKLQVPQTKGLNIQSRPAPDLRFAPAEQSRKYEQFRTYVASVFNMAQLQPQLDGYDALPKGANRLTPQQKQYRANHPQVDHYLRMYGEFLKANPDVAFMLHPQGQRYYQTQATMGQTVTQLQKMIRQMGR